MTLKQTLPPDAPTRAAARERAGNLLEFLDRSPTPWHATAWLEERLHAAGFRTLDESQPFCMEPGKRYLVKREGTSLVALIVGTRAPAVEGYRIVGAHTDSPGLRLKPVPERRHEGLVHLAVEVYGGPILATWLDRDLGLAGRVLLSDHDRQVQERLYRSAEPMVCLPNVAIHQNREVNDQGLKVNPQTELAPILGSLAAGLPEAGAVAQLLARDLGEDTERILAYDLLLHDTQPGSLGGAGGEFLRSGRMDDLSMCHAALLALLDVGDTATARTRVAVFYDHEEVGSQTSQGARSTLLPAVLERISLALGTGREGFHTSLASSVLLSADNAHAVHPGYAAKMDPNHMPVLNGGPVIKAHAGRAYATDGWSSAFFAQCCRHAGVPFQQFVNRSDVKSGSTIGSMTAAQLGIRTVDVGNPQYAMHSVREMAGTWDHHWMVEAMKAFFQS